MNYDRIMLQHVTGFILVGVALVCAVFYLSEAIKSGDYMKLVIESFVNETQTSKGSEVEKVTSFDHLICKEGYNVNETAVSNATLDKENDPNKELKEVLRNAANEDNIVILTVINRAFAAPGSLLDMFLESFRAGENIEHMLNHLVIITMDQNAYDRCQSIHPYCHFLKIEGADYNNEERFMTKNYLEMMWNRNIFQLKILELGFSFLFTDADILWFRDPFKYISVEAHIAMACDKFDPYNQNIYINGGFLYAKSCKKTIEFYKAWQEGRQRFQGNNEQDVINLIKDELVSRSKAYLQLLDTTYMGTFCQLSNDLNKICTLHANCCVGLENKYHDLKVAFEDWKNFTAKSVDERRLGTFRWRRPEKCT